MTGRWCATVCTTWLVLAILHHGQVSAGKKVTIDAAYNNDIGVVLVAGNEKLQIKLDASGNKEVNVGSMGNTFPVQAAYMSKDLDNQLMVYGGTYGQVFNLCDGGKKALKYDAAREFLHNGGPDAVGEKGGNVYFFRGSEMAIRYRWNLWGQPEDVEMHGLPSSPDAAWSEGEDMVILKGDQIWRWTTSCEVIGPCPFSESYSISSWELVPNKDVKAKQCADGWVLQCSTNRCFQKFQNALNFEQSKQECEKLGGNLATIRNERDNNFVKAMIHGLKANFFIGLNDIAKEGDFRWVADNSKPTFTDWDRGQPDNWHGNEDCVHYWLRSTGYRWNDINCGTGCYRICERSFV